MVKKNSPLALCVFLLCCLSAALLASCDFFDFDEPGGTPNSLDSLGDDEFYAQDFVTKKYYKVKAECLAEGTHCTVWVENGCGVTKTKAEEFAKEYDEKIRPGIVGAFSKINFYDPGEKRNFTDMLEFANWKAGRKDKKLTILLLDIQDWFKDGENSSYVAGYFYGADFFPRGRIPGTEAYSNGRDMIYIDTYPGLADEEEQVYATFAHELQHLINYVTTIHTERTEDQRYYRFMDTWIDEGLSSQAEHIYLDDYCYDKIRWFINDRFGTIAKGNNFFIWGNHTNESSMANMDDYATVYLFFRWLYLQADEANIFYEIETSTHYDYRAVTSVAKNTNSDWEDWEPLLRTWLAANYYSKDAVYGYIDANLPDEYTIKVKPINGGSVKLYPGEGVYSQMTGTVNYTETGKIRYAGLSNTSSLIDTSSSRQGDVLLTFNANTALTGSAENGLLTSVILPAPSRMATNDIPGREGPYVIDARDLLGRGEPVYNLPIR